MPAASGRSCGVAQGEQVAQFGWGKGTWRHKCGGGGGGTAGRATQGGLRRDRTSSSRTPSFSAARCNSAILAVDGGRGRPANEFFPALKLHGEIQSSSPGRWCREEEEGRLNASERAPSMAADLCPPCRHGERHMHLICLHSWPKFDSENTLLHCACNINQIKAQGKHNFPVDPANFGAGRALSTCGALLLSPLPCHTCSCPPCSCPKLSQLSQSRASTAAPAPPARCPPPPA